MGLLPVAELRAGGAGGGAERVGDYEVIIGEEDAPRGTRGTPRSVERRERDVLDYTFGVIGANYTFGDATRVFAGVELGFDVPFDDGRGRFYVSGEATHSSVELEFERRGDVFGQEGDDESPPEIKIKTISNSVEVADAFLQYSLFDSVVLSVGRRRQVWGQFDFFSPVGLLSPVRFQSTSLDYKKSNYLVPQDNASLVWFLTERLELQAHFFLTTQIDPLLEEIIEMGRNDDPEDHKQYALRAIYRPDWGTVGATFYRGRQGLFYYENASLVREEGRSDDTYTSDFFPDIAPVTAYAFEIAIPSGRWVWKAEFVYQETKTDLPSHDDATIRGNNTDECFNMVSSSTDPMFEQVRQRYLCSVFFDNNGSFVIDSTILFAGFGVDVRLDRWLLNLGMYLISSNDAEKDELRALSRSFSPDEDGSETDVFPTVSVVRFFGADDRYNVGLSGGFLGAALGIAAYSTARVGDNLTFYAGADIITAVSDNFLEEANEDRTVRNPETGEITQQGRYELKNDPALGFRVGMRYAF